jgi:hypothetical protein
MDIKNIIFSNLYIFNLIFSIICLKLLNLENIIYCFIIYGYSFPFLFFYFIIVYESINPINIITAFLDYTHLILLYVGIKYLNIAQYLGLRTLSSVFNYSLSKYFLNKEFCIYQQTGIALISTSSITLLILGESSNISNISNIIYGTLVTIASLFYSIIGFIMESYKEQTDFIHIKLISSFLFMTSYLIYSLFYNISPISSIPIISRILILFIGISEYIYYYIKELITKHINNSSIHIGILDITRRVITIIIFNENYETYIYICYSFIILGCILFTFNNLINNFINNQYDFNFI